MKEKPTKDHLEMRKIVKEGRKLLKHCLGCDAVDPIVKMLQPYSKKKRREVVLALADIYDVVLPTRIESK